MAIKTISLELDAYEKLRRAKRNPRESFSSVVRRAKWEDEPIEAGRILEHWRSVARQFPQALLDEKTLESMEGRERTVRPSSRWEGS